MIRRTRIELKNCAKTFADGTHALDPFNLVVEGGETLVLLGPSGCGKTTALRMIAGLEFPDAGGAVLFDGEDVTALPIEKRRVGMVFQSYALFPNMTVARNIAYGLDLLKLPKAEIAQRTQRMLEMMHIGDLADRRIDQLSGGQKQRVALARAIAVEPRVLLLDEPLTALDAKLRVQLRTEINALLRSLGITAIYVTHDQDEAMALGDRIVVMQKGKIAQIGAPRDIYHQPQSRFVAEFIGTTNRLTAAVRDGRLHLPGHAVAAAQHGDGMVEVLFRPETLTITDPDNAHLTGHVVNTLFLGDRVRINVAGLGEHPIIVDAPARFNPTIGDQVHLSIDHASLMIFPHA